MTTRTPTSSYKIAVNYNVALNSLTNIELIRPTNDEYFFAPVAIPFGAPGVKRVKLDGSGFRAGYPSVEWRFDVLTRAQYEYLKSTYCSSGYTGLVTVYTTVSGNTYARYNAVIDVPETITISSGFYAYRAVSVRLSHLVAL
jgi:hypothetical protein